MATSLPMFSIAEIDRARPLSEPPPGVLTEADLMKLPSSEIRRLFLAAMATLRKPGFVRQYRALGAELKKDQVRAAEIINAARANGKTDVVQRTEALMRSITAQQVRWNTGIQKLNETAATLRRFGFVTMAKSLEGDAAMFPILGVAVAVVAVIIGVIAIREQANTRVSLISAGEASRVKNAATEEAVKGLREGKYTPEQATEIIRAANEGVEATGNATGEAAKGGPMDWMKDLMVPIMVAVGAAIAVPAITGALNDRD